MSEPEYQALRDLVHARFGIFYDESKRAVLQARVAPRLAKVGCKNFSAYADFLRNSGQRDAEYFELASLLTNNETYFFRERAQHAALCGTVLDDLLRRPPLPGGMRLRLWSAACSTGEEPYSLSMALLDSGRISEERFTIKATDISPRALMFAGRAIYRNISFRATDPALIARFFREVGDEYELEERVKRRVEFSTLNLMDDDAVSQFGPYDGIFCRNVLIYFDKPTQKRVVESFARALRPEGYLFLGHSESLFQLTEFFEPLLFPDTIVYRLRKNAVEHVVPSAQAPSTLVAR